MKLSIEEAAKRIVDKLQADGTLGLMTIILRLMWERQKRGRGRPPHPHVDHWVKRVQAELNGSGRRNGDRKKAFETVEREHEALEKELNAANPGRKPVPFDVNAIENKMRRRKSA